MHHGKHTGGDKKALVYIAKEAFTLSWGFGLGERMEGSCNNTILAFPSIDRTGGHGERPREGWVASSVILLIMYGIPLLHYSSNSVSGHDFCIFTSLVLFK